MLSTAFFSSEMADFSSLYSSLLFSSLSSTFWCFLMKLFMSCCCSLLFVFLLLFLVIVLFILGVSFLVGGLNFIVGRWSLGCRVWGGGCCWVRGGGCCWVLVVGC